MKIYSSQSSPRLKYTLKVIFGNILNAAYELITDESDLPADELFINYSSKVFENGFQVLPDKLLFEDGVKPRKINIGRYKGQTVLFFNSSGDLPFDLFSAVFYMLSRYEEYLPFSADKHGRFMAKESLAFREGFHQIPIVEVWVKQFAGLLGIEFPKEDYSQLLTIDIDLAWKYKNKGALKTIGGMAKALTRLNFKESSERAKVLAGQQKDPGNSYVYLDSIQQKLKRNIQYFILVGRHPKYDNAHSINKSEYKALLRKLHKKNKVGFHPSYQSNFSFSTLGKEYYKLCSVFTQKIIRSRQHYLMLSFPQTYENLMKLGIKEDYSLGWGDHAGFRAGISRPYPFFNLLQNKETFLKLIPFAVMDRTLKDYMKLSPEEAFNQIKQLVDPVKEVGGQFTMLWHNDSLTDYGEWKGWKPVFEKIIDYAG